MRTGTANLPMHWGKAPKYLFHRMSKLAREIITAIVEEYGPQEVLNRLADPYWFQSFGCVLGYDWHSSGLTTVTCGAIKDGLKGREKELGFFVAGGKGGTSRKTPSEILSWGERVSLGRNPEELVHASKMSAKVDSAAIQDGYQLYHHNFFFTEDGSWTVVQQGMNTENRYARRYHWMSKNVKADFTDNPETGVCDDKKIESVLNLTNEESSNAKKVISEFTKENPDKIFKEYKKMYEVEGNMTSRHLQEHSSSPSLSKMERGLGGEVLSMPKREWVTKDDIKPKNLYKVLTKTYENQPKSFEQILGMKGIGPKSIRALTLISEIAYGTKANWEDPVKFSFAHGGKDGYPFPVDRKTYDQSIHALRMAIQKAKLGKKEKKEALLKLIE